MSSTSAAPPPSDFSFRFQHDRPAPNFGPEPPQSRHTYNSGRNPQYARGDGRDPPRPSLRDPFPPRSGQDHRGHNSDQFNFGGSADPNLTARPGNARPRGNHRGRGRGRGSYKRHAPTAERDLLLVKREATPELLDGLAAADIKFKDWDEVANGSE